VWQLFRAAYQMLKPPYLIGGLALLSGYTHASLTGIPRAVSPELMRFHRRDQMKKLRAIFRSLLRLKKINAFQLSPGQEV
jgi:hypothetical protein